MVNKKNKLIKKYLNQLKEIQGNDIEENHIIADDLLCDLLIELGYKKIIDVYDKLVKYYS